MQKSDFENKYPLIKTLKNYDEVLWTNPKYKGFEPSGSFNLSMSNILDAKQRLKRFAPFIEKAFPETKKDKGIIESPLVKIDSFKKTVEKSFGSKLKGNLFLKCDNFLSVSGSIKARGGIYEVLKHCEDLAINNGLLSYNDDYSTLLNHEFKNFFSSYSISVGSTGNLGLSIGIMGAKLGFNVNVHMSSDAKKWKKDLLKEKGVNIIEYKDDYSKAVEEGRKESLKDIKNFFIDDENSKDLFLGYSVAAIRLKDQLTKKNIAVDKDHPLFVYLPCGVGGGPGGIGFGLKQIFKKNVHIFFAEPTHSPCMLLGLMTGLHEKISIKDIGLDNITDADGLAVGRASGFVGKLMETMISGIFTIDDSYLFKLLYIMNQEENIFLEPSAAAGTTGSFRLFNTYQGINYLKKNKLSGKMDKSTHIAWGTGGSMVPLTIKNRYLNKGKNT